MGKQILAIDPGNIQSAYVVVDKQTYKPLKFDKVENIHLRGIVDDLLDDFNETYDIDRVVIEMIGHYGSGMPAGKEVFDTCIEIGRLSQLIEEQLCPLEYIKRATIKARICGISKAKDSNVIQALKDRFGDKGTKKEPGWFYGFRADIWQAYAVAVTWLDQEAQEGGKA